MFPFLEKILLAMLQHSWTRFDYDSQLISSGTWNDKAISEVSMEIVVLFCSLRKFCFWIFNVLIGFIAELVTEYEWNGKIKVSGNYENQDHIICIWKCERYHHQLQTTTMNSSCGSFVLNFGICIFFSLKNVGRYERVCSEI